ncbi:Hypothetical protein IALB_0546 [Ignavibacterium album JCM 16511]|uniref:Uncharacterized protein n=1 Tax=Ignavibacterium album (strain DSM 19864 / JCM 16511 / NBRC 101810 / Mat9-16) TaxID=945713 RepID=I0AH01_IGNAJ|nr:Hypothetical protein IALB_0546 [Ignavibacterium album JCM 16511]
MNNATKNPISEKVASALLNFFFAFICTNKAAIAAREAKMNSIFFPLKKIILLVKYTFEAAYNKGSHKSQYQCVIILTCGSEKCD